MKEKLQKWYIDYRKNRDIMLKKIDTIKNDNSKGHIIIKSKDGKEEYAIVHDDASSIAEVLKSYDKNEHVITVILNKKAHINILIKEWQKLVEYSFLTIMFVNPESSFDKKWIIKPAIHDRITEKSALKQGIMSIAESVELC